MVEEKNLPGNEQSKNPAEKNDITNSIVQIIQPKHFGFTRTLLLAMFAAMIGTGAQYGYALGVMNAPSEVNIYNLYFKRKESYVYS